MLQATFKLLKSLSLATPSMEFFISSCSSENNDVKLKF